MQTFTDYESPLQERREPSVGPGPAQIWRISAAVLSKLGDLQKKKGLHRNSNRFSGQN